jgi:hypothetical protein
MSELTRINRNEIMEYILMHNHTIKKNELEVFTIGELVLMKVRLQITLENK